MGAIWRLYYGGSFGQRLGGKYGPLTALTLLLAAAMRFTTEIPELTYFSVGVAIAFMYGFRDWSSCWRMSLHYTVFTVPLGIAWFALADTPWPLLYCLTGLSGLAYPILNRLQPTPWLGYAQWAEAITGFALIDGALLIAWFS